VIFEELNLTKPLLNALEDLGYVDATPIQQAAFPVIMSGKDVIGIAQTGTGKTYAYLLPILRQLTYSEQRQPRVLIIVPTRELVLQVVDEIRKLTKYMTVRFAGIYGGTNINTQKQLVYNGLDILVATPGRLYDLALTGVLRLNNIQKFVIDEVDELLNLGFRPQLMSFMETLPQVRQNLMFSATLTADVEKVIDDFFYNPFKIEIAPHGTPIEKIEQSVFLVPNFFTKINLLEYLLDNNVELEKVLVFVETKKLADRVFDKIVGKYGEQVAAIHSNKSQSQRINTLKRFKEGNHRVLIATDIMARGLDISDVSHVLNFDTPSFAADYIHRIGRTGRADKPGKSITFVNQAEQDYLLEIEKLMKRTVSISELPKEIEISNIFTDEERPKLYDKTYLKKPKKKTEAQAAFHEKKEKNKKQNSGSPAKKVEKWKTVKKV